MKAWCIAISCLLMATPALADGMEPVPAPSQGAEGTTEAAPQNTTPTRQGKGKRSMARTKSLPKGDIRHCLDLKDNMAIIRCAETTRGR